MIGRANTGYRSTSAYLNPPTTPIFIRRLSVMSPGVRAHRRQRSGKPPKKGATVALTPSAEYVGANFGGVAALLMELANTGIRRAAYKAVATLKKHTAQSLDSQKLAKSWELRVLGPHDIASSAHPAVKRMLFGYGVTNTDPRAYDPVALRSGYVTDLLEMLEYGTRPHRIYPKDPKGKLFFWWQEARTDLPITGTQYFLGAPGRHVNHPGTRPYGFIRIAVAQAAGEMIAINAALGAVRFLVGR